MNLISKLFKKHTETSENKKTENKTRYGHSVALEPRFMFDAAGAVTAVDVATEQVVDAQVSESNQLLFKEIAFIRVNTEDPKDRLEIEELAHRYGAHLTYASGNSLVFEKTGSEDQIRSLYLLLEPFGIDE